MLKSSGFSSFSSLCSIAFVPCTTLNFHTTLLLFSARHRPGLPARQRAVRLPRTEPRYRENAPGAIANSFALRLAKIPRTHRIETKLMSKKKNAATGAYANPFYGAQCCHRFQRLLFRASPPICASSIARTGTFVNRLRLHRTLIESDLRKRNGKSSENPFTCPSIRCFHPPERLGCHLALFGGVLPN